MSTPDPQALRYAIALSDTTQRYLKGLMVKSTWKTHTQHLWASVYAAGLTHEVRELLGCSCD